MNCILDGWPARALHHSTLHMHHCTLAPLHSCTLQFPLRSHRSLSRSWPRELGSRWHARCTRVIPHWIWHGWKTGKLCQATSTSLHSAITLVLWQWIMWGVMTAATTHVWPPTLQEWLRTQHISSSVVTYLVPFPTSPDVAQTFKYSACHSYF